MSAAAALLFLQHLQRQGYFDISEPKRVAKKTGVSIKCSAHPTWAMKGKPTSNCDICHGIWELIRLGAEIVK